MNRPKEDDCDGWSSFTFTLTRELGMGIYRSMYCDKYTINQHTHQSLPSRT